ncbi:MAG: HlyD family secretion protein [Planctomycetota bacterium]|jgi:putative peptide zinc metalloprotease protein
MNDSYTPKFHDHFIITPYVGEGGRFRYFAKDEINENIFEFGEQEYLLCQTIDGQTPLNSIRISFEEFAGVAISSEQLKAFVRHLESIGALDTGDLSPEIPVSVDNQPQRRKRRLLTTGWTLRLLTESLSWCFSPFSLLLFVAFLFFAIGIVFKYGGEFVTEITFLWERSFFLYISLLGIFVINVMGELAKAVACRYYGGHISEFGLFFLIKFVPRFYFDINDALWMNRKADRLIVFSAGLICQLLLWAVGVIGWKNTIPSTDLNIFWLLFTVAATIFFLLNAIPFFQRDGYYLISIWLDIPDLRERAVALVKSRFLRKPIPEPLSSREIRGFKWYGMLCLCFQFIFWGLLLGFTGYFLMTSLKGMGAVIFFCLLMCRFGHVVKRVLLKNRMMKELLMNHSPAFIRWRLLVRLGLLIVLIIMALLPYPFTVGGEFRLLPVNQIGIRAQVSGEIDIVFVSEGQWVKKNDPIAKLKGRDQKKRVEAIKAALDEAQARLELLQVGPKPEAIDRAEQEVKAAAKSLEYSKIDAERARKMFKDKAISEKDYDNALRKRDLDQERLVLVEKNLVLVKSGAREEEIRAVEAEIQRLRVESSHAEEELELTTLTSPADGRIITPYLSQKIGQVLGTGELFAVVEDANTIIAEIGVPEEDIGEVRIGSRVKLKTWVYPNTAFWGEVVAIAPVAYEKKQGRVERTLTEREWMFGKNELLREEGKVVRVLTELTNAQALLKTDMTGYAKIDCETKPVVVAFTRWLVRFILIEVWSWIP